jgi:hypothetical protein
VAGVPVSLRLSPALARLYRPAFAATTVRDRPRTETTIDGTASLLVWDSASTGVPAPPSPWSQSDYLPRDGIRGSGGAELDYAYVVEWRNLSVWDRRDASGVFWAADAGRLPYWDSTAPLRYLVNWALADRGVVLAHAAAVGTSDGGVLLTGRGGSGKSTSALACLAAGWSYVSDDYCALPTTGDRTAHAVYSVGKLDEASCRLLPSLAAHAEPGPEGSVKHLLRPDRIAPKQTVDRLALRAVVVPRVAASTGQPVPIPAAVAVRSLAASTIYQMAGTRPEALALFGRAVAGLPAFRLDVGPDIMRVPETLGRLLARSGRTR